MEVERGRSPRRRLFEQERRSRHSLSHAPSEFAEDKSGLHVIRQQTYDERFPSPESASYDSSRPLSRYPRHEDVPQQTIVHHRDTTAVDNTPYLRKYDAGHAPLTSRRQRYETRPRSRSPRSPRTYSLRSQSRYGPVDNRRIERHDEVKTPAQPTRRRSPDETTCRRRVNITNPPHVESSPVRYHHQNQGLPSSNQIPSEHQDPPRTSLRHNTSTVPLPPPPPPPLEHNIHVSASANNQSCQAQEQLEKVPVSYTFISRVLEFFS